MSGTWRDIAKPVIRKVIAEHEGLSNKEMKKLINKVYPFGVRQISAELRRSAPRPLADHPCRRDRHLRPSVRRDPHREEPQCPQRTAAPNAGSLPATPHLSRSPNPQNPWISADIKESDTSSTGSKQKRVGSSLRKLIKQRFTRAQTPDQTEPGLAHRPNVAATGAGIAAAANLTPALTQPESQLETAQSETALDAPTSQPELETVEQAVTPVNEATTTTQNTAPNSMPNTQNVPPNTANTIPPVPPIPPRPTRFGGAAGGAGVPPIPAAVNAANFMPAVPNPAAQNQAPTIIENRNNSGPALIVGA